MVNPKRSISRTAEAYDRLRRDVVEGKLAPGRKLVLADLQEQYGLGTMPLREALNRLSAEQLVVKHEQRGFAVPPLDAEVFLEIQNARIVIECAALRESVTQPTEDWEDQLVLAFHHLSKASDGGPDYLLGDDWSKAHANFHKALISGCANSWLLNLASQLYKQSSRYRTRRRQIDTANAARWDGLLQEHREIMASALKGNAEAASRHLIEHYRRSVETVLGEPVALDTSTPRFFRDPTARSKPSPGSLTSPGRNPETPG